jgi:hypothetical protein
MAEAIDFRITRIDPVRRVLVERLRNARQINIDVL